jgi:hypothetical protein
LKINKFVSKTQKNILVAYKQGDLKKVHDLQYQLLMSFEGRALVVRNVE